jgi:hypothetical protein
MMAENKSYIGEYIHLKESNAPTDKIIGFIRTNRFYNKPLCDLSDNGELSGDMALKILGSLFVMDYQDPVSILKSAAKKLLDDKADAGVYSGIVGKVMDEKNNSNIMVSNEFYKSGEFLLKNNNHIEALTAYINALKFKSIEEEKFDAKSFDRIEEISVMIDDEYFREYVKEYRNFVPGYINEDEA